MAEAWTLMGNILAGITLIGIVLLFWRVGRR